MQKQQSPPATREDAFTLLRHPTPLLDIEGDTPMQRDLSPEEARSGVVSGRVITVLIVSFLGALAALSGIWFFFFRGTAG
jgi:hypothetical protein